MKKILLSALLLLSVSSCGTLAPAFARWKPEYASMTQEDKAWYARQQTTEETRKRLNANWYKFCCDHADTVTAKFSKQNGHWVYLLPGSDVWHTIPDDVVQPDVQTPHSKMILFIDQTYLNAGPVCFFPGGTGT